MIQNLNTIFTHHNSARLSISTSCSTSTSTSLQLHFPQPDPTDITSIKISTITASS
jgi:hypothetical protein